MFISCLLQITAVFANQRTIHFFLQKKSFNHIQAAATPLLLLLLFFLSSFRMKFGSPQCKKEKYKLQTWWFLSWCNPAKANFGDLNFESSKSI